MRNVLKVLIQKILREALEAELEEFLDYRKYEYLNSDNYRNGSTSKTIKTTSGLVELKVLRDREGELELRIVRKRQTMLDELEHQIVALYSKGMTTSDIQEISTEMYGFDVSPSLISKIRDRLLSEIEERRSRPLKEKYFIVWIDCIFYKAREENQVRNKAVYVAIGLDLEGRKEILGFWINGVKSSRFCLGVLAERSLKGSRQRVR